MAEQIVREYVVSVGHSERVPSADGYGFTTRRLPDTQERVRVIVNVEDIAHQWATKATRSKSGRSRAMKGCVVVVHQRPKRRR